MSVYDDEVLADTPLVYYRLGETSGSTAADSSGNGRDATYDFASGEVIPVAGLLATDVDGAVQAPDTTSNVFRFDAGSAFVTGLTAATLEGWYLGGSGHNGRIIADDSSSDSLFEILAEDLHHYGLRLNYGNAAGDSWGSFDVPAALANDGAPHHLALTWDGTTVTAYLDGTAVGTGALTGTLDFRYVYGNAVRDTMVVDEVALYGAALSPERVAARYAAGAGDPGPGAASATVEVALPALTAALQAGRVAGNLSATYDETGARVTLVATDVIARTAWITRRVPGGQPVEVRGSRRENPPNGYVVHDAEFTSHVANAYTLELRP